MARILIIDDDRLVREAVQAILTYKGFNVHIARDGRDGMAAVERENFDLVIVDIFMPGMDGLETIRAFRSIDPELPIIAVSGFAFRQTSAGAPDFLHMAGKLGAQRTLRKPLRSTALVEAIETCLTEGGPTRVDASDCGRMDKEAPAESRRA